MTVTKQPAFYRICLCPICRSQPERIEQVDEETKTPIFAYRCSNQGCGVQSPFYPRNYPEPGVDPRLQALHHWNNLWDLKEQAELEESQPFSPTIPAQPDKE